MKLLTIVAVSLSFSMFACGKDKGGDSAKSPADICTHIKSLAEKEGGKALETYQKRLDKDCAKELGEEMAKLGENTGKFTECVMAKKTFTEVFDDCRPRKFRPKKTDEKKEEKKEAGDGK